MGLIKNNYEFKGIVIPAAYAIAQVDTNRNTATFYVGANRESAIKQPIEVVKMSCCFDRNENPFVTAYKLAKGQYEEVQFNEETGHYEKVTVNQPFYGWDDDIVTE